MAGHHGPEGGVWLMDLGEPIEYWGTTTHGVHCFMCVTI